MPDAVVFSRWDIYWQGLLALSIALVLPGLALSRFFRTVNGAELALVSFLGSIIFVYAFVIVAATLGLSIERHVNIAVYALLFLGALITWRSRSPVGESFMTVNDLVILLVILVPLGFALGPIWFENKLIFLGSDPLISWDAWAKLWATGEVPIHAHGYPQLVPALWSVPYWFMGNTGQFFARAMYGFLVLLPILLAAWVVLREAPVAGMVALTAFVFPIGLMTKSWVSGTLTEGFPDWIAVSFVAGGLLLLRNAFHWRRDKPTGQRAGLDHTMLAMLMFSIAASVKLVCGLFAIALLVASCGEAWRSRSHDAWRGPRGLAIIPAAFVALYCIYFIQVVNFTLPPFERRGTLHQQVEHAYALAVEPFGIWTLIAAAMGVTLALLASLRAAMLSIAIVLGMVVWICSTAYDLRAALPFIIGGVVMAGLVVGNSSTAILKTAAIAPGLLVIILVAGTLPLARPGGALEALYTNLQMQKVGLGRPWNDFLLTHLKNGCNMISPYDALASMSAFKPFIGHQLSIAHQASTEFVELIENAEATDQCFTVMVTEPGVWPIPPALNAALERLRAVGGAGEVARLDGWRLIQRPRPQDPAELRAAYADYHMQKSGLGQPWHDFLLTHLKNGCNMISSYDTLGRIDAFKPFIGHRLSIADQVSDKFVDLIEKAEATDQCFAVMVAEQQVKDVPPALAAALRRLRTTGGASEAAKRDGWNLILRPLPEDPRKPDKAPR